MKKVILALGIGLMALSSSAQVQASGTLNTRTNFKITQRWKGVSSHGHSIPVIYDANQKIAIGITAFSNESCRRSKTGSIANAWHSGQAITLIGNENTPWPKYYHRFGYYYIEMDVRSCPL